MDIAQLKKLAMRAAHDGGAVLKHHFGNLTTIRKKGLIDLVTVADIESEQAIIQTIRAAFPDHTIVAEESGLIQGQGQARWIIDPLDGTTNFAHGLPIFAVSIGFWDDHGPMVGIVYNPVTDELFSAVKSQGASLNGRAISVSTIATLRDSLLVTGFPYEQEHITTSLMLRFNNCLAAAQGLRRLGSAALDLCYVGCGRFEGFWEENLKPWDTAAGMLIAIEAGGVVTDFTGRPYDIDQKQILATNGRIHSQMLAHLQIEGS